MSERVLSAVIVGVIVVVVAGCGGDDQAGTTAAANATGRASSVQAKKRPQKRQVKGPLQGLPPIHHFSTCPPGKRGSLLPGTFPAEILNHGGDVAPSGSAASGTTTNGWHVSNHRKLTAVVAGRSMTNKSDGDFDIYRESYICTQQKADSVTVPGTGAVRITDAPEGRGPVQTSSQERGDIEFTSASGVTGTLHLADDTVTLNR